MQPYWMEGAQRTQAAEPSELQLLLDLVCATFAVPLAILTQPGHPPLTSDPQRLLDAPDRACARGGPGGIGAAAALDPFAADIPAATNVWTDPRFRRRRLAFGGVAIGFLASVPVSAGDRQHGSLSIADTAQRILSPAEGRQLADTARVVAAVLRAQETERVATGFRAEAAEALRRAEDNAAEVARYKQMYEHASAQAKIGVWECDLATEKLTWTDGVYDIFELPRGCHVTRAMILDLYYRSSRVAMDRLRSRAIAEGSGFVLDIKIRTAAGRRRWVRLTAEVESEHGKARRIFGLKQDITQEKDILDRLRLLAEGDSLTGLANRAMFERTLAAWSRAPGRSDRVLVLIDLDGFKAINDTYGHAAGDACLQQVAARLKRVFRGASLVCRIGGDEFAVLLGSRHAAQDLEARIKDAIAEIGRPLSYLDETFEVGASVGVAVATRDAPGRDLFAEADAAMYAAKKAGRNGFRILAA